MLLLKETFTNIFLVNINAFTKCINHYYETGNNQDMNDEHKNKDQTRNTYLVLFQALIYFHQPLNMFSRVIDKTEHTVRKLDRSQRTVKHSQEYLLKLCVSPSSLSVCLWITTPAWDVFRDRKPSRLHRSGWIFMFRLHTFSSPTLSLLFIFRAESWDRYSLH